MSKYTTEVRYICEKYAGLDVSADYLSIGEIIERARGTVFNFDYPIFDESYRSVLETKILKHFYTREIGEESVGLWKLRLDSRMNEIMPYYNQRYASELIKFNPLYDTELATSRNDTFNSDKNDNNVRNTVNDGADITNSYNVKNVTDSGREIETLSGSDVYSQTGTIASAHTGNDNVAYDDRDSADDDTTIETWTNEKTTDMHYESDTPQSTISAINDSNYATSFTKDTHERKNDNLSSNSDNYTKTHDKTEHNNHNDTRTTYNDTVTQTFNKSDTTQYGKTDTTQFGKITDTTDNLSHVLNFGKTTSEGEVKIQGLKTTDEWLETMVGKRNSKSYSQMLNEFRTTFLNIDMEIINELNDLFFNLW